MPTVAFLPVAAARRAFDSLVHAARHISEHETSVANAVVKRAGGATTSDRADASLDGTVTRHDRPKRDLEGTR